MADLVTSGPFWWFVAGAATTVAVLVGALVLWAAHNASEQEKRWERHNDNNAG